jgi:tetratricopeptide (TPR) repeat protein
VSTQYHYLREGQQFGPVSAEQLRQMATSGWLRPHDLVWTATFPGWVPASKVKGLYPEVGPVTTTPPPLPAPRPSGIAPPPLPTRRPGIAAPPLLPQARPTRWGLLAGVGAVSLVVVVGVVWLIISLTRPADDNRRADNSNDKKDSSTTDSGKKKDTREDSDKKDVRDDAKQDSRDVSGPKDLGKKDAGKDGAKKDQGTKEERKKEVNPEAARAVERGDAALNKGDLDQAVREYTEALRLQPGWAWAYCQRGQAYMYKKDFARSIADCDQALQIEPRLIEALWWRGCSQYDGKDYDAAIVSADRALKLDNKAPVFYYLRGSALLQKGSLDRAVDDLSEAIRLNPKNPNFFNHRGLAYEKRGNTALAKTDYERRDALLGRTSSGLSDARQRAKVQLDQAQAAYLQAKALYDADDARYVSERNLALAQNGRRAAMGLPPLMPRPVDPTLSARMNAAFQAYQQAKRVYDQTP